MAPSGETGETQLSLKPLDETDPLRFFGGEIRRAREAAGYTLRDVAALTHYSAPVLSRIERGEQAADLAFAKHMDGVFPERDGYFERYWIAQDKWKGYSPLFTPWVGVEQAADAIRWWTPGYVPGLLQTEDYARAVILSGLPVDDETAQAEIEKRMERQRILTAEHPTDFLALLDECVLRREVGSPQVMAGQLEHMLKMAGRPNVTIQVVPDGLAGLSSAIGIANTANADVAAYLDASVRPSVDTEPEFIRLAARLIDHLRASAAPVRESLALITEAMERWNGK